MLSDLKRPGDTRWSSHYGALVNLIHMLSFVRDVIETIIENGLDSDQRGGDSFVIEGFRNWKKKGEITESRWGSQQCT